MTALEHLLEQVRKTINPSYIFLGHEDYERIMSDPDIQPYYFYSENKLYFNGIEIIKVEKKKFMLVF